jgi:hypothetical protein
MVRAARAGYVREGGPGGASGDCRPVADIRHQAPCRLEPSIIETPQVSNPRQDEPTVALSADSPDAADAATKVKARIGAICRGE